MAGAQVDMADPDARIETQYAPPPSGAGNAAGTLQGGAEDGAERPAEDGSATSPPWRPAMTELITHPRSSLARFDGCRC